MFWWTAVSGWFWRGYFCKAVGVDTVWIVPEASCKMGIDPPLWRSGIESVVLCESKYHVIDLKKPSLWVTLISISSLHRPWSFYFLQKHFAVRNVESDCEMLPIIFLFTAIPYRAGPVQGQYRARTGFSLCSKFSQGKTCFHCREPLFSLQRSCIHYRDFPVRITTQGNPCSHYREWVCSVGP